MAVLIIDLPFRLFYNVIIQISKIKEASVMRLQWKKPLSLMLAASLMVIPFSALTAWAAKKKKGVTLSKTSLQVKVKKSKRVKIKNSSGKKIKSVKWTISKGKSVIGLSKKNKSGITIKGKKKGSATVKAKIKAGAKTYNRTLKVSVTKPVTDSTLKLDKTSLALKTGETGQISIRNTTGLKISSVKWSVTAGGDAVSLSGQSKKSVSVKAVKQGAAKVQAKIKTTEGTATRTASVTAEAAPSPDPGPVVNKEELIHYDMTCSMDGKKLLDQSGRGNDAELTGVSPVMQENQSLLLEKNGFIKLPEKVFAGKDTLTISIWLRNYSFKKNTSAMYVGTKESLPVSYWILNPSNLDGRMKSVITDSSNAAEPWSTEVGISASVNPDANGVNGPITEAGWNHYVTVITPDSITGYLNGEKVGSAKTNRRISDFGSDIAAYIGKSSYNDPTWMGFVRDVRVYDKGKTDVEIAKLYADTKVQDVNAKGTETEVFIENRADPHITRGVGEDGKQYYYFTASYPMDGEQDMNGYDRVVLRRSETLEGLKNAEEKVIWKPTASNQSHRFIWAPEMHYIGGKWYMYYAGSSSNTDRWLINCCVLQCSGQDPYNDSWTEMGKFQAVSGDTFSFSRFSLDMTYFECNGKHYVIWAQQGPASNLYMAQIDPKEPWKTITQPVCLTRPEYYWECATFAVNEGPSVLQHDGRVIIAYSASGTGPEYCIGYLYADATANLMNVSSWTKQKTPALTSEDLVDEYGPGHNSFTKDEAGNDIFVYHSRGRDCYENKCGRARGDSLYDPCRSARIRKVVWGENGLPILNR